VLTFTIRFHASYTRFIALAGESGLGIVTMLPLASYTGGVNHQPAPVMVRISLAALCVRVWSMSHVSEM